MGKIEIDARTLARVYDLAEKSVENTREAINDEELPDDARAMMRSMLSMNESSLETVEQKLENDPEVEVEP